MKKFWAIFLIIYILKNKIVTILSKQYCSLFILFWNKSISIKTKIYIDYLLLRELFFLQQISE